MGTEFTGHCTSHLQCLEDSIALRLLDRQPEVRASPLAGPLTPDVLKEQREVFHLDLGSVGRVGGPLQDIDQLPDIPRPIVTLEEIQHLGRDAEGPNPLLLPEARQEVPRDRRDVLASLP